MSLSLSVSVFVKCCGRVVVVCCGILCRVLWRGVWCVVWCGTLKNPCVRSTRPRVYRHHAHMLEHVCAWCRHTRRRVERTHGDVWSGHTRGGEGEGGVVVSLVFFISKTSVFFDIVEHLNWVLGSSLIANFLLAKMCPHMGSHLTPEVHQRTPWILQKLRMGRAQSLNTPLLPVAMYSSYAPFLSCSFFFFLFFHDDAMKKNHNTRTKDHHDNDMSTTPHHTQPPNQQRRATPDMTRHHTTIKKTKTHTYTHMYMYMYMSASRFLLISHEQNAVWNTYLPLCVLFQAFDLPQWLKVPFLIPVQT